MSRHDEVLAFLRQYVADIGEDPDKVEPAALLEDIGIDSLQAVELSFQLEERFGVARLDLRELATATVADAVEAIVKRLPDTAPAPA